MSTMLIAQNETRESGSFMGDQLCSLKTAYLFVEHAPPGTDRIIMSASRANEMDFLWTKFIEEHDVEVIYDDWSAGDWNLRWQAWDKWRTERKINDIPFDHYRELYLRIHGGFRQSILCGGERGLGRRNIYQYWWCGQEGNPDELPESVDWFDDTLIHHPELIPTHDVYISPHAKTQGNNTFTFEFWRLVALKLLESGISVTVGYDDSAGQFYDSQLRGSPLYRRWWGSHRQWMEELCRHRLVLCGNTGTGWLAAACGVPMITMEPPGSQMPDHRYRECGLRNIVEVVDVPDPEYVARKATDEIKRVVVMTTGCYDILHAGHVRHLERSKALGTKLIVALNSDSSVRGLKGPERPINPQGQRKAVLEALRCVDEVRIFDGPDALPMIEEIKPNVLTNGYGYSLKDVVGRELVEGYGGKVVVTCRSDASDEPSTSKIARSVRTADLVELCRVGASASVNPYEKLRLMAEALLSVRNLPGDIADLGACRGGTSLIMRRLVPDKHLHVFDTWEGTPYDDPLCHHKRGEWSARMEDCQALVGNGEFTHYHRGTFPDYLYSCPADQACTTRTAEDREYCFVYVDMDTERATHDAIMFFWPLIVSGGIIMIDDYGWEPCAGVKKAVDESFDQRQIKVVGHTCMVVKP